MSLFLSALKNRVLVFDGAMGTQIHALDLDLNMDYLGKENCPEVLNLSRPDAIETIHAHYFEAGADAVETNSFGGAKLVLAEFDLADRCHEINKAAAAVARKVADRFSTPGRPRFVIGSIGPGTKLVTLGNVTWDVMLESYTQQALGLIDGGADALLIETCQDLLQVKCAVNAIVDALAQRGRPPAILEDESTWKHGLPIMVQVTIETTGTMLLGTEIAAAAVALRGLPIVSLGLNCATGPVEMAEHIHWLGHHWDRLISVLPNAGLPVLMNGKTEYPLGPEPFAQAVVKFAREAGVNIIGGCCGTTPEHIREVVKLLGHRAPVQIEKTDSTSGGGVTSLYDVTEYRQDNSVLIVGERTNASGSRAFKKMLEAEDWDAMVSLAREQVKERSHLIDVNVDYAGRDNARDMSEIVKRFVRQVNVPLMLDSTQPATLEAGLKCAPGKCVINSANLEDGEEKFERMIRLARRYGAAIVLGTIDEDKEEAMARTADRKLAIASRMHELAVQKLGLDERDIFFDPLVLPISTGMDKDRKSALETIEGSRRIREKFPGCQIVVGLSNVSFGLKPRARVVLNSVFLHELMLAGVSAGILHSTKILPKTKIPDAQWNAALDLIYDRRGQVEGDPLQRFIDLFPDDDAGTKEKVEATLDSLPIEERLRRHIIDGEKRHLAENLDEARKTYTPLAIINDHLLDGMKTVGELFGSGQMQLPFVLQSAEVMKMAVAHLERFMEKAGTGGKGSIVLATVKGDVHDIGKNLVDIILTNNGYVVYNLGIKQPIGHIVEKWREYKADAIGLSGLLVKSVQVMKENLEELNSLGITVPVILGGAALSRHYCEQDLRGVYQGKVYYGRDAFEGLRLMDFLVTHRSAELDQEIEERLTKRAATEAKIEAGKAADSKTSDTGRLAASGAAGCGCGAHASQSDIRNPKPEIAPPPAPFFGDRVVEEVPLDAILPFVNRVALYRGQWQFRKGKMTDEAFAEQRHDEIDPIFDRLAKQCKDERILTPKVVYGYFPVNSDGNDLVVYDAKDHDREIERFAFPRQSSRDRLCISDYFLPASSGKKDVLAVQCVTVGPEASVRTKALFEKNNYTEYLYLHGFAVECAEALAEFWHKRVRQELGIAQDDAPRIRGLFAQGYRGSRYSFGYPACPDMSDQEKLFRLIKPDRIGCALTENWQIDPEQSTSAIIVHHPQAKYFNV